MSSTRPAWRSISRTFHHPQYVYHLLRNETDAYACLQKVTGYLPNDDGLKKTLEGCNIVVIPAGIPRKPPNWPGDDMLITTVPGKPDMTRDDLFKINAGIVRDLVTGVAKYCPKAFVLVISNPVNSTVPIAAEILKAHGVFDAKRLFGVTTLDVVRASTFTAEITGESDSRKLYVPVVGGHSGDTIVPLFSQAKPSVSIPADKIDGLVNRVFAFICAETVTDSSGMQAFSLEVMRS